MKKILLLSLIFILFATFPVSAEIGSKGLILEGGEKSIILKKGEKQYLNVQDGLTKIHLIKGISFYSDNTMVATVGLHSGILRANGIGTATITAISKAGDAGQIKVKVTETAKAHPALPLLIFLVFGGLIILAFKK